MTHVDVVAAAQPALRRDRSRASHVIQKRQVVDVRNVGVTPTGEASKLNREPRIAKRALGRNIVRQIGGERNCRQELGQSQTALGLPRVDYVPTPAALDATTSS